MLLHKAGVPVVLQRLPGVGHGGGPFGGQAVRGGEAVLRQAPEGGGREGGTATGGRGNRARRLPEARPIGIAGRDCNGLGAGRAVMLTLGITQEARLPIADTRPPVRRRPVFVSPTPFDENRVVAGRRLLQRRPVRRADGRVPARGPEPAAVRPRCRPWRGGVPRRPRDGVVREGRDRAATRVPRARAPAPRIVLIAHDGCAFYKSLWLTMRTVEEQQAADLTAAADVIRLWNGHIEVEGYFSRERCRAGSRSSDGSGRPQLRQRRRRRDPRSLKFDAHPPKSRRPRKSPGMRATR